MFGQFLLFYWSALLTSTTTSLLPIKYGMAAAWTGVILGNPMVDTASRIHSASGGVRESQALGSLLAATFPGAMVSLEWRCWILQRMEGPVVKQKVDVIARNLVLSARVGDKYLYLLVLVKDA